MKKLNVQILLFTLAGLFAGAARAQMRPPQNLRQRVARAAENNLASLPPQVRQLLSLAHRPTMAESIPVLKIMPDLDGIPSTGVNNNGHVFDPKTWTAVLLKNGPALIATMEKTFPGATWAFIGRDSQAIADMVEAFYLSIGQQSRVVRIMVSKPSFQNVEEKDLVDFIRQRGFSFKNIENSHPYVFVDTVSGGNGRQGRQFLQALYSHYHRYYHGEPADLLTKLNMFGLIVSTHKQKSINPSAIPHVTRDLQIGFSFESAKPHEYGNEFQIVGYVENKDKSNEAGYEHFTGAWTGPFGQIVDANGRLEAVAGPPSDSETRQNILWMQREIWRTVSSPSFLHQVMSAAEKLNFKFPLERPIPETVALGQIRANLPAIVQTDLAENERLARQADISSIPEAELPELDEQQIQRLGDDNYTSNHRLAAAYWNNFAGRNDIAFETAGAPVYLDFLIKNYRKKRLSKSDVAVCFGQLLNSNFKITSDFLVEYARLQKTIPDFDNRVIATQQDPNETTHQILKINQYLKHRLEGEKCSKILSAS